MINYKKTKKIHYVGIKGVGMTPLAILAKEAGFEVTGSDIKDEFITDKLLKNAGIKVFHNFSRNNINGVDLVIATGAHGGLENVEVSFAKKSKIPVFMQGQAVGEFMKGDIFGRELIGISVAGCHGKTTTTAMVATIFKEAGLDPSYIIGTGEIPTLGSSGHYGKGKYFIAEADEYATEPVYDKKPKFLWQYPKYLIITNIEFDHPDLYKNIEEIENAYKKFIENIGIKGKLITNKDEIYSGKLYDQYKRNKISFGFNSDNEYIISNLIIKSGKTCFLLNNFKSKLSEEFTLNLTGRHNVLNACAAAIAAIEAGIRIEKIKSALQKFKGTKRRFEYKGKLISGAEMFDDYAHHPSEIRATLLALRELHPGKKIICIFQPHTYSRTKKLFDDFTYSFKDADQVIITDIYASQREKPDSSVSSEGLVEAINRIEKKANFVSRTNDVVKYILNKKPDSSFCIITMGAGDIYKIHEYLREKA